jgi:phenylacetate-CoA ligase
MTTAAPPQHGQIMAALPKLLAAFSATERLDAGDLRHRQETLLDALIDHHATSTPSFRLRLDAAGLLSSPLRGFDRLSQLAPLSRREIQDAGAHFISARIPPAHHPLDAVKTSGSTGEPIAITKTAINRLYWSAFALRDHAWNRRNMHRRLSVIRAGISDLVELPDWGAPANLLFRTGPCLAMPMTTPVTAQLEHLDRFSPETLLVYPNNLRALADDWIRSGEPPAGLRHIRTIGETVSEDLRQHVRLATGLRIEDSYSSQEAGPIAIQCPEGGLYHVMAEALHVEILDSLNRACAPGDTGRVVVTDLHNYASPLIRYDIADFATVAGPCSCGRTLPTLARIIGRERNLLRRRNGDRHWPLVGFHDFDKVALIRQYQIIQHTLDDIELRFVTDEPLHDAQQHHLTAIVAAALGEGFRYRLSQTRTRLQPGPNGKFEEFVCRVA